MTKKLIISMLVLLATLDGRADPTGEAGPSADTVAPVITDLSDHIALRTYLLLKVNTLEVTYGDQSLRLAPNSPFSLGAGFNYKGIGIALGIGMPLSSRAIRKYGKTTRLDIQASINSSKFGGQAYFQLYRGYYNSNPDDFIPWDEDYYPQIPDMKTISFGVNGFYLYNHENYSLKAAYSRTQIQRKSSGSALLGYFFNYDEADSPVGFIPEVYPDSIARELDLGSFRYFATGISAGYAYTWVISKSIFVSGSLIPGFGYKDIVVKSSSGEKGSEKDPHAQLLARGVIGFEKARYYAGLSGMTLIRTIKYGDYNIHLATEQFRFYIGLRLQAR